VKARQADHRVATLGRVLGVSPSGDSAWQSRPPAARAQADAALLEPIRTIHDRSRGTDGAPRLHAEVAAAGVPAGRQRIARLMHTAGLAGISRRPVVTTTPRDPTARPAPDLVQRSFTVDGPDRLWVADLTDIPTGAGVLYLAAVLDAWSRRGVGWGDGHPPPHGAHPRRPEHGRGAAPPDGRDPPSLRSGVVSTRRWPSGSAAERSESGPRWGNSRPPHLEVEL